MATRFQITSYSRLCCVLLLASLIGGQALRAQDAADNPILELNASGHTDGAHVVFSPDGRTLFSASKDKTVRIWDVASGESIRVLHLPIGPGRLGTLYGLDIAPDGKLLAVGGVGPTPHEAWIYLVSLPAGQIVRTLRGHAETVIAVKFFPDGKRLASCGEDKTARIWNVETGHCDQVLTGHTGHVYDLAISPDGQRIVTVAFDGTARIWSTESGVMELELRDAFEGKYYWMRSAAWSPDGKTIATGSSDGIIRFWTVDGDVRSKVGPLGGEIQSLDFDRGSRKLLFTDSLARRPPAVLDLESHRELARFNGHRHDLQFVSPRRPIHAQATRFQRTHGRPTGRGAFARRSLSPFGVQRPDAADLDARS